MACLSYSQKEPTAAETSFPALRCVALAMHACGSGAALPEGKLTPARACRSGLSHSIWRGWPPASGWRHTTDPHDAFPQNARLPQDPMLRGAAVTTAREGE